MGLLYQDIIRSQSLNKGDKLPPVMPIVIYNGSPDWTGPVAIDSLIDSVHPALSGYAPRLSYLLLQEKKTPKDYSKQHPDNLVGHLIAKENCGTPDDMRACIRRLHQQLKTPRYQDIRRSFSIWLSRLLRVKLKQDSIPEYQELNEVDAMLAEQITDWTLQWQKEGEKIGEKGGEKRGVRKEAAHLLTMQIRLKYGDLSPWAEQRIQQADTKQLEQMGRAHFYRRYLRCFAAMISKNSNFTTRQNNVCHSV